MKNIKYLVAMCLVGATTLFVGCDKGGEGDITKPSITFPELKEFDAEVDAEYSIAFDASSKWNMTSDVSWIEFKDGDELYPSATGAKGEHEVTFVVNSKEMDFDSDKGSITLKIDTESKVVATVTRSGREAKLTFYKVDVATQEETEIPAGEPLVIEWSEFNFNFSTKLHFKANFDWKMEGLPAWINNPSNDPIPSAGEANVDFQEFFVTDYAHYTTDEQMEATITVVSLDNPEISYPLTIKTVGAKGLIKITATDGFKGFNFEVDGTYINELDGNRFDHYTVSYVMESSNLYAPFSIECESDGNGGYWFGEVNDLGALEYKSADSWVWVDPNESKSDEIYPDITLFNKTVMVQPNTDEARAAAIFSIPGSEFDNYRDRANLFTSDGTIKPEVEKYILGYVNQDGATGGNLDFAWPNPDRVATITKMEESHDLYYYYLYELSVPANSIYILEYPAAGSEQINFPFNFNFDTDAISVSLFEELNDGEVSWLSVEPSDTYFTVLMNAAKSQTGSVVLKQSGVNKVAIHCVQSGV